MGRKAGLTLYSTSLALNYIWSPMFFTWNVPRVALVDIVLLAGSVMGAARCFFKVDEVAGWLLVPYMAWLGYATYLCAGTGYLNDWDVSLRKSKKEE